MVPFLQWLDAMPLGQTAGGRMLKVWALTAASIQAQHGGCNSEQLVLIFTSLNIFHFTISHKLPQHFTAIRQAPVLQASFGIADPGSCKPLVLKFWSLCAATDILSPTP